MKTIGELLSLRREQLELSIEDVESKLHIRKRYLAALEQNDFSVFSSPNYIRGFIKNYSEYLDLDSAKVLAVFRRQYATNEAEELMPEGVHNPLDNPIFKITPQRAAIVSVFLILLIFFVYLFSQARGLFGAPTLELVDPVEDKVVTVRELELRGNVNPEAQLSLNGKGAKTSADGEFVIEVELIEGVNEFVLEAVNSNGEKTIVSRSIRYQP